jgi:flagellar hook-basal body complex protein FliE
MNLSGIHSIGTQPVLRPPTQKQPGTGGTGGTGDDFGNLLKGAIDKVDQTQADSAATVQQLLSGKNQDVLPVVQAVAKADMSFKLLIGVRNKVIEAYKQTMNMQV